ncbi:MAG TPA: hypothetical protein VH593_18050, partial [Ktedonobacteraceae bacterium]
THVDKSGEVVFPAHKLIEPAEIVLRLGLQLYRQSPKELTAQLDKNKKYRKQTEPSLRHLGSIFRDATEGSAAELLRRVGLADKTQGQAQASELNPNYIINKGGASAADIIQLIGQMHHLVLEQCNVDLVLNVELLGDWASMRESVQSSAISQI